MWAMEVIIIPILTPLNIEVLVCYDGSALTWLLEYKLTHGKLIMPFGTGGWLLVKIDASIVSIVLYCDIMMDSDSLYSYWKNT